MSLRPFTASDATLDVLTKLLDIWSTVNGLPNSLIFVVSFSLPLLFILCHLWWFNKNTRTACLPNSRVLHTLSAFVTPTSCASISVNSSLLKNTKIIKSYLIKLDLSDLIDAICSGKAELRNSNDLYDLFREKLRIYGWHLGLLVGRNWSFRISRWMIAHHSYIFVRSSTFPIQSRNLNPVSTYHLDLDFVPFHHLEKEINEIRSSLPSGSTIILEFSCLAPAVRFMSRDFILCAIPFLLRTYKDSKEAPKHSRTTTPLLTRLNTFIALLSSESSKIRSIVDISRWHAHSLLQLEENLSNDRHLRMTCVQEEGIAGWREKKFMLAWEAGLLRAGFLTRWRVVLVK